MMKAEIELLQARKEEEARGAVKGNAGLWRTKAIPQGMPFVTGLAVKHRLTNQNGSQLSLCVTSVLDVLVTTSLFLCYNRIKC